MLFKAKNGLVNDIKNDYICESIICEKQTTLMNKTIEVLLLVFCFCVNAIAQNQSEFSVAGFEEKPFDISATDARYKIVDGNGELFSIIKLVSTTPDDDLSAYSFDFGMCEGRKKIVDGEVWWYVQRNAMRATIRRDGFKAVKYELNTTVQPGKVYEIRLSTAPRVVKKRYLMFKIRPADSKANIQYRYEHDTEYRTFATGQVDADGNAAEKLLLGRYYYKITSKYYHTSEGVVDLTDAPDRYIEEVTLCPNYGTLALSVANNADIYIDDEKVGCGTWSGKLTPGIYEVETVLENHSNSEEYVEIQEGETKSVVLKSPVPITGGIDLNSSPLEAEISIDGKKYGTTPMTIDDLLIGEHVIAISKFGYENKKLTVTVKKGECAELNVELEKSIKNKSLDKSVDKVTAARTDAVRKNSCRYKKNSFYMELTGAVGHLMDVGLNAGCYLSVFNMELYGYYGLQKGIFYSYEKSYNVCPVSFGGRLGVAIPIVKSFVFTPQFGVGTLIVTGNEVCVSALTLSLGVRSEYFFTKKIGISITPEYVWDCKSDAMKTLLNVCPIVDKWCSGFNARFGVYYNF